MKQDLIEFWVLRAASIITRDLHFPTTSQKQQKLGGGHHRMPAASFGYKMRFVTMDMCFISYTRKVNFITNWKFYSHWRHSENIYLLSEEGGNSTEVHMHLPRTQHLAGCRPAALCSQYLLVTCDIDHNLPDLQSESSVRTAKWMQTTYFKNKTVGESGANLNFRLPFHMPLTWEYEEGGAGYDRYIRASWEEQLCLGRCRVFSAGPCPQALKTRKRVRCYD